MSPPEKKTKISEGDAVNELAKLRQQLAARDKEVKNLIEKINDLHDAVVKKDEKINDLHDAVVKKDEKINDLNDAVVKKDDRIAVFETDAEAVSLFATLSDEPAVNIPFLTKVGKPNASLYPSHELSVAILRDFTFNDISTMSPDDWKLVETWMKQQPSLLHSRFYKKKLILSKTNEGEESIANEEEEAAGMKAESIANEEEEAGMETESIANEEEEADKKISHSDELFAIVTEKVDKCNVDVEADTQLFVHLGLEDATNICQIFIDVIAKKTGMPGEKTPMLVTRKERSIFSNRVDHAVVFDLTSQMPLFSIETKSYFNNPIVNGIKNRVYGQSLDQLRAMQAKGHNSPFAAITSYNETFITWLDTTQHTTVLASHKQNEGDRLRDIVRRLPNGYSTPPLTQSPPKAVSVVTPPYSDDDPKFEPDLQRLIVRSEKCFCPKELVRLFANVIFCALDATFTPKTFQDFQEGKQIVVDAIQMKAESYNWGILTTKVQGPLLCKEGSSKPDLFIVDYLGSGSTSVVHRAFTLDGHSCVVKLFVGVNNDKQETENEFMERSKEKVEIEADAYKKIYGTELDGYVWTQTLNKLNCVVMPFFVPIKKEERAKVLSKVQERLEQFKEAKMVFKDSDQLWQHVGTFQEKIFLFDLGDLQEVNDSQKVEDVTKEHFNRLKEKTGDVSVPIGTPTRTASGNDI